MIPIIATIIEIIPVFIFWSICWVTVEAMSSCVVYNLTLQVLTTLKIREDFQK